MKTIVDIEVYRRETGGSIVVRSARETDKADWRRLWADYNQLHGTDVPPDVVMRTWRHILDPDALVFARMASDKGRIVGFTMSVLHQSISTREPACYLEDLVIDPDCRGKAVSRQLIQDLVELGRRKRWSRLYWNTRWDDPAIRLYDALTQVDEFARHRLQL